MVVQSPVQCYKTLQEKGTDVVLLNNTVDGVLCEYLFCRCQVSSFLKEKSKILCIVDPNYNAKNSQYQMFGGSWETAMGQYVLDTLDFETCWYSSRIMDNPRLYI